MHAVPCPPEFFGRTTAASIQHLQLAASLRRLQAVCATTEAGRAEVRWYIAKLKRSMLDHFAREESDACFGVVERASPQLAARVGALRAEHGLMLEATEELWRRSDHPEHSSELSPLIDSLLDRYQIHERAEAAVMRAFLGDSSP